LDRIFKEFEAEFHEEFHRVTPSPFRAVFSFKTDGDKEVMLNLEAREIKAIEPLPSFIEDKIRRFADKHQLTVKTSFSSLPCSKCPYKKS
jgi:hypothetical protein